MGQTLIEKIIASHAGRAVVPGEIVDVEIDVRAARDFGGANVVQHLEKHGLPVADPARTLFTFDCNPGGSGRNSFPLNFSLDRILEQRLSGLGIPVIYGLRFGHSKEKFTIPLGVMASLEATDSGVRFKIEESATL